MRLESNSISNGATLPPENTAKGGNEKPRLRIEDVPPSAKSLALIFYDIDKGDVGVHWMVWNIPPDSREVRGTEGTTSSGEHGYYGPDLSVNAGVHRLVFHLFALSVEDLKLQPNVDKSQFMSAISGRVVEEYKLMVRFGRPKPPVQKEKKANTNWF
ncbi:MAG: YbhB/YbcL family Raf kinase inhibitor-like protein [Candidatus Woesearchaeota archaeon]